MDGKESSAYMDSPANAIHRAVCEDNPALLRDTLAQHPELKARINDPDGPFDSPLINSVKSRAMLDAVLEAGADINVRSQWWAGGFGLLDTASDDLAVYALERGARLDVHSAARLGRLEDLRRMVDANPNLVHARGGDGKMALHFARNVEVAAFLVEHGADLNARDIDHESTPAQYLIAEQQEVVRYLVQRGCEVDIFIAAALGDTAMAERLIQAKPDCLRWRVNAGSFPMKHPRAGGTIYQWTLGFNRSPHEVARGFGHGETLHLLVERSPAEVRLLMHCWAGEESEVRSLLEREPNVVSRMTAFEQRQLPDAARNDDTTAVRLMLEAGLSPVSYGQHHATPLHWACWHGNSELVPLLLEHGAPLEDADNEFAGTPLGWAIHGSENGWHRERGNYPAVVRPSITTGEVLIARSILVRLSMA